MAWVRSEYAGALAVLCTWAAALLPWSVTVFSLGSLTQVIIRFQWVSLRFQYGAPELDLDHLTVLGAFTSGAPLGIRQARLAWLAAMAVITALVSFSLAYYFYEDRVERLPVDPVRLTGGTLLVVALAHALSLWLLWEHRSGLTVPVGTLFEFVFAGLLLTVERDSRA